MTRARGFTLIELVVVIVLMGIIAVVGAKMIVAPTEAYLAVNRRAQITDTADVAMRRLSRDLRLALPNSVRVGGANRFLEFVPTRNGSRYRVEGGDILDFGAVDTSFDYLGESLVGEVGSVVVFNTGQRSPTGCAVVPGGADVYEGCNRSAISAVTVSKVSFNAKQFSFDSPGHRFHIVPTTGPVTLACENVNTVSGNGTGTLRLYTRYAIGAGDWGASAPAAAPVTPGLTVNVLADHVSACSFIYVSGVTAVNGLVTLRLTLTRGNETITLHHQVHVDNVP
jgi:MSHA biogenesis protein MshO